jgi:hypothetical protein
MKKEIFIHFSFLVVFFFLISLFRGWMDFNYWSFWLGGMVGTLLPDLDHFIYVYFLRPHELTSQRVGYLIGKREILKSLRLLAQTRSERTKLIFHTANFQLIFLVLTFLVITSSGSLFGRGLVLAFGLHLLVDQVVDLKETGSLDNWFSSFLISLDNSQIKGFWLILLLILLVFGFLL